MKQFGKQVLAALVAIALIAAVGYGGTLLADTLTIPYKNKSEGDTIYASHWTANFQAIEDVVNDLDDDNFRNGGITASTKLVDGSVTNAKQGDSSINSIKIEDETVESDDILDGTLALTDYGDDSIDVTKTRGLYLVTNREWWKTNPGGSWTNAFATVHTDSVTTDAQSGVYEFQMQVLVTCTGNETVSAKVTYDCGSGEADLSWDTTHFIVANQPIHLTVHDWLTTTSLRSTACTFRYKTKSASGVAGCTGTKLVSFSTEWQIDT